MRKQTKLSKQIIKAITLGLSASMMLQPVTSFAEGVQNLTNGLDDATKNAVDTNVNAENDDEQAAIDKAVEVDTAANTAIEGTDGIRAIKTEVDTYNNGAADDYKINPTGVDMNSVVETLTPDTGVQASNDVDADINAVISDLNNAKDAAEIARANETLGDLEAGKANAAAATINDLNGDAAGWVDENSTVQEKVNEYETAVNDANTAGTKAATDESDANTAVGTANTALAAINGENGEVKAVTDAAAGVTAAVDALNGTGENKGAIANANDAINDANTAATAYNNALSQANTDYGTATAAVTAANDAIQTVIDKVDEFNKAKNAAQTAIDLVQPAKNAAATALAEANAAITNAENALSAYNTAVAAVNAAVEKAQEENDKINAAIAGKNTEISAELAKVEAAKAVIASAKADVDTKIAAAQTAYTTAKALADENASKVANKVAVTDAEAAAAKAAIADYNTKRQAALDAINVLKGAQSDAKTALAAAVQAQADAAGIDKTAFTEALAAIETAKGQAEAAYAVYEAAVSKEAYEDKIEAAKKAEAAAVKAVKDANDLIDAANALVPGVNTAIETATSRVEAAETAKTQAGISEGLVSKDDYNAKKALADTAISAFNTAKQNLANAVSGYTTAYNAYVEKKAEVEGLISTANTAVGTANTSIGDANSKIDAIQGKIDAITTAVTTARTELGKLLTTYNEKKGEYDAAVTARGNYVSGYDTAISSYKTALTQASTDLGKAEADFAILEGYVNALGTAAKEENAKAAAIYDAEKNENKTDAVLFETIVNNYYIDKVSAGGSYKLVKDTVYELLDAKGDHVQFFSYKPDPDNAGNIIIFVVEDKSYNEEKLADGTVVSSANNDTIYAAADGHFTVFDKNDVTLTDKTFESNQVVSTDKATEEVSYIPQYENGYVVGLTKQVKNNVTTTTYTNASLAGVDVFDEAGTPTINDVYASDALAQQAYRDALKADLAAHSGQILVIGTKEFKTADDIQNADINDLGYSGLNTERRIQNGFTMTATYYKKYTEEVGTSYSNIGYYWYGGTYNINGGYFTEREVYSKALEFLKDYSDSDADSIIAELATAGTTVDDTKLIDENRTADVYNFTTAERLAKGQANKVVVKGSAEELVAREGNERYALIEKVGKDKYKITVIAAKNQVYAEYETIERDSEWISTGWGWGSGYRVYESDESLEARAREMGYFLKIEGNKAYYVPKRFTEVDDGGSLTIDNKEDLDRLNAILDGKEEVSASDLADKDVSEFEDAFEFYSFKDGNRRASAIEDSTTVTSIKKSYRTEQIYGYAANSNLRYKQESTQKMVVAEGEVDKETTTTSHVDKYTAGANKLVEKTDTEFRSFVDETEKIRSYNQKVTELKTKLEQNKTKIAAYKDKVTELKTLISKAKYNGDGITAVDELLAIESQITTAQTKLDTLEATQFELTAQKKNLLAEITATVATPDTVADPTESFTEAYNGLAEAIAALELVDLQTYTNGGFDGYKDSLENYSASAADTLSADDIASTEFANLLSIEDANADIKEIDYTNNVNINSNTDDVDDEDKVLSDVDDLNEEDIQTYTPEPEEDEPEVEPEPEEEEPETEPEPVAETVDPSESVEPTEANTTDPGTVVVIPEEQAEPEAPAPAPAEEPAPAPAPAAEPVAEPAVEAVPTAPVIEAVPTAPAAAPAPAPAVTEPENEPEPEAVPTEPVVVDVEEEGPALAAAPQVTEVEEEKAPLAAVIEDEDTPLANLPEAAKMNWWWLLLVLVLGTSGAEMYRRHLVKKNAAKTDDTNK